MGKKRLVMVKRDKTPVWLVIINTAVFVILALAFCGIFMVAQGFNPIIVYAQMFASAFGSGSGFSDSIVTAIPLMLCGLGVSVAFKMNLNNIGAEGQYAMGALTATGFMLFGPDLPAVLQIPIMILIATATGAIWSLIAAIPRAKWNVNETITTLMLNYVALLLLDYVCYGPWKAAGGLNLPYSAKIPKTAYMAEIGSTGINIGFIIAIVVAIFMFWFFKYTTTGYQISVIKHSVTAAKYAGINVKKNIIIVMLISGALAGMTGAVQVCGVLHRLQPSLPNGAGFTAIVIAYLSKFNPIVVILVSIFFGGLSKGSYTVQTLGVPSQVATMLQGSILIFVLAGEILNRYRFKRVGENEAINE